MRGSGLFSSHTWEDTSSSQLPSCGQSSRDLVLEHVVLAPLLELPAPSIASSKRVLWWLLLFCFSPLHEVTAPALVVQVQATAVSYQSPPGRDIRLSPSSSQRDLYVDKSGHIMPLLKPSEGFLPPMMKSTLSPASLGVPGPPLSVGSLHMSFILPDHPSHLNWILSPYPSGKLLPIPPSVLNLKPARPGASQPS